VTPGKPGNPWPIGNGPREGSGEPGADAAPPGADGDPQAPIGRYAVPMPSLSEHQRLRRELLRAVDSPVLLMAGGHLARNYPDNPYPFRADSNFLALFPDPEPDSAALLDPATGEVTLFLEERTPEGALWHGAAPSFDEMRTSQGVSAVEKLADLESHVARIAGGRPVRGVAVADPRATARAAAITGEALAFRDPGRVADRALIAALGRIRLAKSAEALAEMRATAAVTREAHVAAMRHSRPGVPEQELAGLVDGTFARHGCTPAYGTILSVRGEVLHNHEHGNVLAEGDIVLLDAGAEGASGYCSDVTRSWPASGSFTAEAGEVYDLVLEAETSTIERVSPGVRYRDLHLHACRVIADGLARIGLLRGDPDGLVESGAHALFFPHGVGHLIGLDVHDMEAFGDAVAYPAGRRRSEQFGLAYLRLDLDLAPGTCVTIEPGIYFVPAILRDPGFRERFAGRVDFDAAERFLAMNGGRGFGGIRIEDDVACTDDGFEVLTAGIPKTRAEVEDVVGTA